MQWMAVLVGAAVLLSLLRLRDRTRHVAMVAVTIATLAVWFTQMKP